MHFDKCQNEIKDYWGVNLNVKKDYAVYWVSFLMDYMAEHYRQLFELVTAPSEQKDRKSIED
jgi:hypothetical protein